MPACTCMSACTRHLTVASCRRWRAAFESTVALAFGAAAVVGLWALLGPALLAAGLATAVVATGAAAARETHRHRLSWPTHDPDTRASATTEGSR